MNLKLAFSSDKLAVALGQSLLYDKELFTKILRCDWEDTSHQEQDCLVDIESEKTDYFAASPKKIFGNKLGTALESIIRDNCLENKKSCSLAWGIAGELYLSHCLCGFPIGKMRQIQYFIKGLWGYLEINCEQYETLYAALSGNPATKVVTFTLLAEIERSEERRVSKEMIFEMFDFCRESLN